MESSHGQASNNSQRFGKESSGNSTSAPMENTNEIEDSVFDNIVNPSNQINCDRCRRNITHYSYILCQWGQFCIKCFATLQTFPQKYRVIGHLNYPLIFESWSALDELEMLGAMERYGYGNWKQIQSELQNFKSIEELESHYEKFLQTPENIKQKCIQEMRDQHNFLKIDPKTEKVSYKSKHQLKMLTEESKGFQMYGEENRLKIVAYMHKRGDFEIEYDNELELIVSEMEFLDSDTPQEAQLKCQVLQIFTERLNKRNQIKNFAVQRKLLDLTEINRKEKKSTKDVKEATALLKPFARFLPCNEYERFVNSIGLMKTLKFQITSQLSSKQKNMKGKNYSTQICTERKKKIISLKKTKSNQVGSKFPFITQKEFQLCVKFQISQITYVLIKQTIKSELSRKEGLHVSHFYNIFSVSEAIVKEIFTHLSRKARRLLQK